jgi:hypothetical protein
MQHQIKENDQQIDNLPQLVKIWDEKCQWYDQNIPDINRIQDDLRKQRVRTSTSCFAFSNSTTLFGGTTSTSNPTSFIPPVFSFSTVPVHSISKESSSSTTEETRTIILNEYNPQSLYTAQISSTNNLTNAYSIYLNERIFHRQSHFILF